MITGQASFFTILDHLGEEFEGEKIYGYYAFGAKTVVVADIDLAKNIMVKDFDHFVDRRPISPGSKTYSNKVFSEMLTVLTGDKWKATRGLLSPIFTSGKLKMMAPLVNKVGDEMVDYLRDFADRGEAFNGKDMMMSYSLDAIATCGFGVECNTFKNPNGQFRTMVSTNIA